MVKIIKIEEDGSISDAAAYSLKNPKFALICYLEQFINNNYNTWKYSEGKFDNASIRSSFASKIFHMAHNEHEWCYNVPGMNVTLFTKTSIET